MKMAILADDLTGAADAALPFERAGFTVAVTTSVSSLGDLFCGAEVVSADLATRSASGPVAYVSTFAACQHALRAEAFVYKKVDSQLRGRPRVEVAAALAAWPKAIAIIAPALPERGRVVRDGRLQGRGLRPLALTDVFSGPWPGRTWQVGLADLRAGTALDRLASLPAGSVVLADAICQDDLLALVRTAGSTDQAVLWVGAGALAGALAVCVSAPEVPLPPMSLFDGSTQRHAPYAIPPGQRGVVVVMASREPVNRSQVEALVARAGAVVSELVLDERASAAWFSSEYKILLSHLEAGGVVVLCSSPASAGASEEGQHTNLVVTAALALILACPSVDLVATGGQTARCLLDAIGELSCRVVGEVEPGIPQLRTEKLGYGLITKAGSFGTELALVRAVEALQSWRGHGPALASPPALEPDRDGHYRRGE